MRFVFVLPVSAEYEKMTIVPPCDGYYTNISFQMWYPYTAEDELYQIYLGTELNEDIFNQMADAGGDRQIAPDLQSGGVYFKFGSSVADDGTTNYFYWKHLGKKKIHIKRGEMLHLMVRDPGSSPNSSILVQGNFIPYRGAILRQKFEVPTISLTDDFTLQAGTPAQNDNLYRFQHRMVNVQVKVTLWATWATPDFQGKLWFKLQRKGQDWFTDTIADGRGDILDTDYIDQKYISTHGIIDSMDFFTTSSNNVATTKVFTQVLNLGNVNVGDFLQWDVEDVNSAGSMAGTYQMHLETVGIVPKTFYTKEGDFLVSPHIVDLNKQDTAMDVM